MKISYFGHCAITLDHDRERLTIDPGFHSDADAALAGAHHVLITHKHAGHMDVARLRAWLPRHMGADVWAPADAVAALTAAPWLGGDASAQVHTVTPGDHKKIGGFEVWVGGGYDAMVHRGAARAQNATYLIHAGGKWLYDPGDSFDYPDTTVALDVLFTPIAGLWMRFAQAMDFVRGLQPRAVLPIHGATLSEIGFEYVNRYMKEVVDEMNRIPAGQGPRSRAHPPPRRHAYHPLKRRESFDI